MSWLPCAQRRARLGVTPSAGFDDRGGANSSRPTTTEDPCALSEEQPKMLRFRSLGWQGSCEAGLRIQERAAGTASPPATSSASGSPHFTHTCAGCS
jgi:hypothetical protein